MLLKDDAFAEVISYFRDRDSTIWWYCWWF